MDELLPEQSPDASTRLASESERFEQGRFDVFHRLLRDRIVFLGTEVDGGIGPATVAGAVAAGANVLVSGSALYRDPEGLDHAVADLRARAESVSH